MLVPFIWGLQIESRFSKEGGRKVTPRTMARRPVEKKYSRQFIVFIGF
jgi:hypothetical protein